MPFSFFRFKQTETPQKIEETTRSWVPTLANDWIDQAEVRTWWEASWQAEATRRNEARGRFSQRFGLHLTSAYDLMRVDADTDNRAFDSARPAIPEVLRPQMIRHEILDQAGIEEPSFETASQLDARLTIALRAMKVNYHELVSRARQEIDRRANTVRKSSS